MSLLTYLFGRTSGAPEEPWTTRSAYQAIRSNVDPSTGRLHVDQVQLPDDEPVESGSKIRWAPGAMDGVFGHHSSPEQSKATVNRLAKLIDRVARTGDRKSIAAAYAMLKDESVLGLIDPTIEALQAHNAPIEPHLAAFALKLATEAADRGPIKMGIALLGVARLTRHRNVVETLGLHEEFTLYSAVALTNMLEDAQSALWQLATKVDGWGRIQIVERLVPTDDEQIRRWLRTEGFRNSILLDYLALIAAEHGKLCEALEQPSIPDAELKAAGEIIAAMIAADDGASAGMSSYADAAAACLAYLDHVDRAQPDIEHFITLHAIVDYLTNDDRASSERLANGWSEAATAKTLQSTREILGRSVWDSLIREHLEASESAIFYRTAGIAMKAGIDPFPWHWQRLHDEPGSCLAWSFAMRHVNADRIDAALELAARQLPLERIATGPADEMGLGREFEAHRCLDAVLQALTAYPGRGAPLIGAGLQSPVVHNRNMSLNALEAWHPSQWSRQVQQALERARAHEVREDLSQRMDALLTTCASGD